MALRMEKEHNIIVSSTQPTSVLEGGIAPKKESIDSLPIGWTVGGMIYFTACVEDIRPEVSRMFCRAPRPHVQVNTYATRNFSTLRPLELLPLFTRASIQSSSILKSFKYLLFVFLSHASSICVNSLSFVPSQCILGDQDSLFRLPCKL